MNKRNMPPLKFNLNRSFRFPNGRHYSLAKKNVPSANRFSFWLPLMGNVREQFMADCQKHSDISTAPACRLGGNEAQKFLSFKRATERQDGAIAQIRELIAIGRRRSPPNALIALTCTRGMLGRTE